MPSTLAAPRWLASRGSSEICNSGSSIILSSSSYRGLACRSPSHRPPLQASGLCRSALGSFTSRASSPSIPSIPSLVRRALIGGSLVHMALLGKTPVAMARASKTQMEQILNDVQWPADWPFKESDFQRYDEAKDTLFYAYPRFVTHIDDPAIAALTKYYASVFPPPNTPGTAILDMCSSWISHYPKGYTQETIVGMGLNEEELQRNPILTRYLAQDLNEDPKLPFEDNTFDVITNAVSVDYLTRPREVFAEMRRVLKPGGQCIMSFSNRCFFTKAISIWTSTGDADHIFIVGAYFHYTGGFDPPQALDISPNPGRTDPMYIVCSRKSLA